MRTIGLADPTWGEIIIGTVAILAAGVVARTATWRQRTQLEHDNERQREQLDHDRRMRDRDELRASIRKTNEALRLVVDADTEARYLESRELPASDLADHRDKLQAADAAGKARDAVMGLIRRTRAYAYDCPDPIP